jgi:thiosulfate dehydrogenase (quinone) large subunit
METTSPAVENKFALDALGRYGLVVARVVIGWMWVTQLQWKMPPAFGCPPNFALSTSLQSRTTGLCDWTGLMAHYSIWPIHRAFVANLVGPNLSWMGWLIWLMEAFIALSLILGMFARLGGLVGLIQAANLYIGLTALPFEWYWTYGMMIVLQLIFFAVPSGRTLGVDAWLRPRLLAAAQRGNRPARWLAWLT